MKILPYANFYNFFFSVTNFFFNLKILFIFVTYRNFVCLEFLLSLFCWWLLLLVVVSVIVVATTIGNLKIWFIFPVSLWGFCFFWILKVFWNLKILFFLNFCRNLDVVIWTEWWIKMNNLTLNIYWWHRNLFWRSKLYFHRNLTVLNVKISKFFDFQKRFSNFFELLESWGITRAKTGSEKRWRCFVEKSDGSRHAKISQGAIWFTKWTVPPRNEILSWNKHLVMEFFVIL